MSEKTMECMQTAAEKTVDAAQEYKEFAAVDFSALAERFSEDDPMRRYLAEVSKVKHLSEEEERKLVGLMLEGRRVREQRKEPLAEVDASLGQRTSITEENGKKAAEQLVEANLYLVLHAVGRFMDQGREILDMIMEGNLALVEAAEHYEGNGRFSEYALQRICTRISGFVAQVRRYHGIPLELKKFIGEIIQTERRLTQELGIPPTVYEVAEEMKLPVEKVWEIQKIMRQA